MVLWGTSGALGLDMGFMVLAEFCTGDFVVMLHHTVTDFLFTIYARYGGPKTSTSKCHSGRR